MNGEDTWAGIIKSVLPTSAIFFNAKECTGKILMAIFVTLVSLEFPLSRKAEAVKINLVDINVFMLYIFFVTLLRNIVML